MARVNTKSLIERAASKGVVLVAAESCTGGLLSAALTEIPGSSAVFDRGFVTYSNASKCELLGVPAATIDAHGAVSAETAAEMAQGALGRTKADISVAITGVAGPGGGSSEKPVGLVHFACARRDGALIAAERRFGALTRAEIRARAVDQALAMLGDAIDAVSTGKDS